jgi:hypothetical protein
MSLSAVRPDAPSVWSHLFLDLAYERSMENFRKQQCKRYTEWKQLKDVPARYRPLLTTLCDWSDGVLFQAKHVFTDLDPILTPFLRMITPDLQQRHRSTHQKTMLRRALGIWIRHCRFLVLHVTWGPRRRALVLLEIMEVLEVKNATASGTKVAARVHLYFPLRGTKSELIFNEPLLPMTGVDPWSPESRLESRNFPTPWARRMFGYGLPTTAAESAILRLTPQPTLTVVGRGSMPFTLYNPEQTWGSLHMGCVLFRTLTEHFRNQELVAGFMSSVLAFFHGVGTGRC